MRGYSSATKQIAWLAYVRNLIPAGGAVILVGNCEFGSVSVLRPLDRWRWFYVLRQKSDTGVWINESSEWQAFGSYVHKPGQSIWLSRGYLTIKGFTRLTCWSTGKSAKKNPGAWPPIYRTAKQLCGVTLAECGSIRSS